MKLFVAISLITAPSWVAALAFHAPVPTRAGRGIELEPRGWSPAPTKAPSILDFFRRQQILVQGLIVGPDGTCGYTSGSSAEPFGLCCSSCSCGFATTPGHYGALYCCDGSACAMRVQTTCIDGPAFSTGTVCDSACAADTNTIKCTVSPYTLCNLVEFETVDVQAVYCDSTKVLGTQSLYTTYAGQAGHVFSPFNSSTPQSTSSSNSNSASSTASTTTSSQTTSVSPAGTSSSSAPVGAIVGGTVGGVAILAILGFLIFFCLRRQSGAKIAQAPPAPSAKPLDVPPSAGPELAAVPHVGEQSYPTAQFQPQYQPHQQAPGYTGADHYAQPVPYNPSATTSPYSHNTAVDPQAVDNQAMNRHTVSTLSSGYSTYNPPPPAGPQMSELPSSGPASGHGGVAGRYEVQG